MSKLKIFIVLFKIISIFNFFAESINLSLNDAAALGLRNNLDIKSAELLLEESKLSAYTVWNKFIPGGSLSGSTGISERDSLGGITQGGSLSGSLDFSLSVNARSFIGVYEALNDYKNGKAAYAKTEANIRREIAKSYFSIVVAAEELAIKQITVRTAENRFRIGERGYVSGEIGEIEKLRREYSYRAALYDYEEVASKYNASLVSFKNLLGLDDSVSLKLTDKVPDIGSCNLESVKLLETSQHINIENIKMDFIKSDIRNAYSAASFIPSFSIGGSIGASYRGNPYEKGGAFTADNFDKQSSLRFSVSIPLTGIFPFSAEQVSLINNDSSRKRLNLSLEKERRRIEAEFLNTLKEFEYMLSSYRNGEFNVSIAEKVFKLTEKAYKEGTKEYADLISAEQDYQNAQLRLLQTRLQFVGKLLDLEYNYLTELLEKIR